MDKLVYLYYPILIAIFLWGAKFCKKGEFNEEFMSIKQTKFLQGFFAIVIMLHHIGQKTCAPWLNPAYIVHGLDLFVPIGYYCVGIFLLCSGFGLYKSYMQKENYLDGFIRKRILPVILAFYSTGLIFLIVRALMGQKMKAGQILCYIVGVPQPNPNTWFVIALPLFYLAFYFSFKYIKNKDAALIATCVAVFVYTFIGTTINHNDWFMCGEWWYNSVHFFSLGLIFARFEEKIVANLKKHYKLYLPLTFVLIFVLYWLSAICTGVFSYYGQYGFRPHSQVVLFRWICLISQMLASCAFVFFMFMLTMKITIGNKILKFMGGITLEFYLIHGLYVELFGFSFIDVTPPLYYIRNVALMVLVVTVLSVPSAILLQKFHNWVLRKNK